MHPYAQIDKSNAEVRIKSFAACNGLMSYLVTETVYYGPVY